MIEMILGIALIASCALLFKEIISIEEGERIKAVAYTVITLAVLYFICELLHG